MAKHDGATADREQRGTARDGNEAGEQGSLYKRAERLTQH